MKCQLYRSPVKAVGLLVIVSIVSVAAYIALDNQYDFGQKSSQQRAAESARTDNSEVTSELESSGQAVADSPEAQTAPAESAPQSVDINSSSLDKEERSITVLYTILGDGSSAKLAPVQTSVKADIVKLAIKLNCESSCRFKLASDAYPLTSSKTYTSSQTIEYTLNKPGEWVFYNEYIPGPKFKVSF